MKIPFRNNCIAWRWWLTPIILATQEAEIRRITVPKESRQTVLETYVKNAQHTGKSGSSGRTPA
jgi:hypothetical protein